MSGQLKLKQAPSPDRPHADKKRPDRTRGDKHPDRSRGEKPDADRRHKPRPKPGRHAH